MSVSARAIAKEELAARINILGCQYADAILDIAEGMALVGRKRFKVKLSLPITNIAQIAINDAFLMGLIRPVLVGDKKKILDGICLLWIFMFRIGSLCLEMN